MANYTILIIDYEPRSIERLRAPLERAGYRIEIAKDGEAGIVKFNQLKPSAVIIEAMLPKRHGFEVCQELKQTEHGSTCPVMIATSVYRGRKYRHQATHLYSCDAYLEKPLADDDLISTVESALKSYDEARKTAAAEAAAAMAIDTGAIQAEIPAEPLAEPGEEPSIETPMEIDTAPLQAEVPVEGPAEPRHTAAPQPPAPEPTPEPVAAPRPPATPEPTPEPVTPPRPSSQTTPQALAEADDDDFEFEIIDKLDALLSDDPSKSSPNDSEK